MEEVKLKIAKQDGFDSWEMMLKCYSTTDAGIRVIDKHITKVLNIHVVGVTCCDKCNDTGLIEEKNEFRTYLCDCKNK